MRILVHKNSDSLHLKLVGEFDGNTANDLLDILRRNITGVRRVFVHTSGLTQIHSFSREEFVKNLTTMSGHLPRIVFTGSWAGRIAPSRTGTGAWVV